MAATAAAFEEFINIKPLFIGIFNEADFGQKFFAERTAIKGIHNPLFGGDMQGAAQNTIRQRNTLP